jgi:hypothetical protein
MNNGRWMCYWTILVCSSVTPSREMMKSSAFCASLEATVTKSTHTYTKLIWYTHDTMSDDVEVSDWLSDVFGKMSLRHSQCEKTIMMNEDVSSEVTTSVRCWLVTPIFDRHTRSRSSKQVQLLVVMWDDDIRLAYGRRTESPSPSWMVPVTVHEWYHMMSTTSDHIIVIHSQQVY